MQQWPRDLDWWWILRKWETRYVAMPPEIEMRVRLNLSMLSNMSLDITLHLMILTLYHSDGIT
jgi:hypothetical protein